MPNPNTTTSSATQQQLQQQQQQQQQHQQHHQQRVRNMQQPNTASPTSNGHVSLAVLTRPVANFETVGSNLEAVGLNAETVDLNVPRATGPTQENTASTSCEVRKRRYTRIASVKLKFHKKQPRISHVGQRRIRNVKVTRQDTGNAVQESLCNHDIVENELNQDAETSTNANDFNGSTERLVKDCAKDASVSFNRIQMLKKFSPTRVGHVRKRRKTNNGNKTREDGKHVTSTTWRISSKETIANSERNKLSKNTNKSMENKPGPSHTTDSPAQSHIKSLWENFCVAKNWERFKLPRIRRLGMYLQETMPSVSQNIRHCVSDLELSSIEEKRLIECGSPKRSVSVSDISSLDSNSTVMSEIYQ